MTDQAGARRNIAVLTTAQALGGSSAPIVMSLGGLVGQQLSGNPAWVTLPVSLFGVGLALGTLPAAFFVRAWGRRNAYVFAAAIGVGAGLIAAFGIFLASFTVFCIGSFTAGLYGSYIQSYRFAAADAAEDALKARAISWVMVGGLVAAVVGPQLVIWTRDALTQTPYAGSFWFLLALLGIGRNFSFIGATAMVTECHTPASARKPRGSMISWCSASRPWSRSWQEACFTARAGRGSTGCCFRQSP